MNTSPEGAELYVRLRQAAPIPLDIEFVCAPGSLTALFGPSGSGKTTILRSIAGLYAPAEAQIRCAGETWLHTGKVPSVPPHRRSVGLVFQDYALFPHMTVREQLVAAMGHLPRHARRARADQLIQSVHLQGLENRRPGALSGGQQQRAAIGRALARDPAVLLLDEPFASVDRAVRDVLHRELASLRRQLRIPMILVTHDFEDVMRLATDLILLENGCVTASGTVAALSASNNLPGVATYREPGVVFDGVTISHDASRLLSTVRSGALTLRLPLLHVEPDSPIRLQIPAREVILATQRPEGISLHNAVNARVVRVDIPDASGQTLVHLEVDGTPLLALVTADAVRNLALTPSRCVLALIKAVSVEAFG
jgi:molybdate transport system ATP-binding protein